MKTPDEQTEFAKANKELTDKFGVMTKLINTEASEANIQSLQDVITQMNTLRENFLRD